MKSLVQKTRQSVKCRAGLLWVGLALAASGGGAAKQAPAAAKSAQEKPGAAGNAMAKIESERIPAQLERLETQVRFEEDGASHKEVHAVVRINSELGVRQFARLNFDYNRSFESVAIPLVRVTHASGGTQDILPGAISDTVNPGVVDAAAFEDIRVKSVRVLGLQPGDHLEYRVITETAKHPLAPDFWLSHSFDRSGVVEEERFELDLPANRMVQMRVNPATPASETDDKSEAGRKKYRWNWTNAANAEKKAVATNSQADVVVTTFASWGGLAERLRSLPGSGGAADATHGDLRKLLPEKIAGSAELQDFYDFVAQKVRTVDVPISANGFLCRSAAAVVQSGYGTAAEKIEVLNELWGGKGRVRTAFLGGSGELKEELPLPSLLLSAIGVAQAAVRGSQNVQAGEVWLDPALEVAPYGVVRTDLRARTSLVVAADGDAAKEDWQRVPDTLPFAATQKVRIEATLGGDGKLLAKVHYALRGDNELLLRVAFHETAKEKWKDLATLLAISDGFRGQVANVTASDPYATREAFQVDYEITTAKFVDWSKKPVKIPALLPQVGLPDLPGTGKNLGSATAPIELGTPLDVDLRMQLKLPARVSAQMPTGTSVERDYATFSSKYGSETNIAKSKSRTARGNEPDVVVTAARHVNFLAREVPAGRAMDYNAFVRAIQNDEAQDIVLETEPAATQEPAPRASAPKAATRP